LTGFFKREGAAIERHFTREREREREMEGSESGESSCGSFSSSDIIPDCLASSGVSFNFTSSGGNRISTDSTSILLAATSSSNNNNNELPSTSSTTITTTSSVPRRMYPTQFKLRVLDSYRNDIDCRGNQRATARKFGIHRRQIQKWLQVEKILRSQLNNNNSINKMIKEEEEEEPIALNLCVKNNIDNNNDYDNRLHNNINIEESHQQTPSPTTSSVSGKRRSFTLQFKLDVLNAFYENSACRGNQRATARLYGINRRQVQKWLCQEVQLRSEAALNPAGDAESSSKRQRLGRWLWTVPQWTTASWHEETPLPNPLPPQDTALCLVKVEKSSPQPSQEIHNISTVDTDTSSTKPKRHSYPLDFKLQALDAYHEDTLCRGNQRAVAKRFSIHRRQIQKWLKQEAQLRQRSALGKDTARQISIRRPAVLKPVQVISKQSANSWMEELRTPVPVSQQSSNTWMEELRAPAPCWS
jgi:DNA-binding protein Fis